MSCDWNAIKRHLKAAEPSLVDVDGSIASIRALSPTDAELKAAFCRARLAEMTARLRSYEELPANSSKRQLIPDALRQKSYTEVLIFAYEQQAKCAVPPTDLEQLDTPTAPLSAKEIGEQRVKQILKAEKELAVLRPKMGSDSDYERLKAKHPGYITFKATERDDELKKLLLGIKGHHQKKALRFAKQIAASECGLMLNTIEAAWDKYKPPSRRQSTS